MLSNRNRHTCPYLRTDKKFDKHSSRVRFIVISVMNIRGLASPFIDPAVLQKSAIRGASFNGMQKLLNC